MTNHQFFKAGEIVRLLPDYQDDGDDELTWVVVEPEDRGRVVISPVTPSLALPPTYAVESTWIERAKSC